MLVMFVVSYKLFIDEKEKLIEEKDKYQAKAEQLDLINRIEASLARMMRDSTLFKYEPEFRRYTLARDIRFVGGKWNLSKPSQTLMDQSDVVYLEQTGKRLKSIIDSLSIEKAHDPKLKEVSYILAIVGSASNLYKDPYHPEFDNYAYTDNENWNYILSYQRAKALYDFWKERGIVDFDSPHYHDVVELVIAGNGFGGVGRVNADKSNYMDEWKNQRFLIQIIPKVGKISSQ